MLRNKSQIPNPKSQINSNYQISNSKLLKFVKLYIVNWLLFGAWCLVLVILPLFAQEEFVYDAKGKRNPFIPLVTSEGRLLKLDKEEGRGKEDLLIEGIIYDTHGRSFAIVNGAVVGVGDTIGNYQVLKVEETKVIFIKEGEKKEIKIEKEEK